MSFRWDNATSLGPTSVASDTVSAGLTVPSEATRGAHMVVATCGDEAILRRSFVVSGPPSALTLTPDTGGLDSQVTATVTNVATCLSSDSNLRSVSTPIMLLWDDTALTPSASRAADDGNSAQFDFPVPRATAGPHTVTAVCGSTQLPATFTVAAPTLTVHPTQGVAGIPATATVSGFGGCRPLSFQWDGQPLSTSADDSDGLNVTFAIPEDAGDRDYPITATCETLSATATFTVASAASPSLTLDPGHGLAGSIVTASGSGFTCGDGDVQLRWDDGTPVRTVPAGSFLVSLTVPDGAAVGDHQVVATCSARAEITASRPFTVASEKPAPHGTSTLTLRPTSGRAGETIQAIGEGLTCTTPTGPVNLSWDDGTPLPDVTLDPAGHFEASVGVPEHAADSDRLTLRARCPDGVLLAADFTLLAGSPPPPPPPPSTTPWLLIAALVAAVLGVTAKLTRRHRSTQQQPAPSVRAVPRADGCPVSSLRETPELGEATHTLRVKVHPGRNVLSLTEGRR